MMQGNQGVRLAASVGHLQLADSPVAPACQSCRHIPGQIA